MISLGFFLLASTRMVAATSRSFQSLLRANSKSLEKIVGGHQWFGAQYL